LPEDRRAPIARLSSGKLQQLAAHQLRQHYAAAAAQQQQQARLASHFASWCCSVSAEMLIRAQRKLPSRHALTANLCASHMRPAVLYPVSQSVTSAYVNRDSPSRRQRERGRWTWAARRGRRAARARAALHMCEQPVPDASCGASWCCAGLIAAPTRWRSPQAPGDPT
jgi:hypothetical protein